MTMQEKTKKTQSGLRGLTRLYVIQLMYQSKFNNKPFEKIMADAKKNPEILISEDISLNSIDSEFFDELITETNSHLEEIDQVIKSHILKNWDFERFDIVMQYLLRLAVCEILYKDTPLTAVFNEYIEIAKAFFKKKEVAFVNGILHAISKQRKS